MPALIFLGILIAIDYEAVKMYLADKYCKEKNGEKSNFFLYMIFEFPGRTIITVILLISVICALFSVT